MIERIEVITYLREDISPVFAAMVAGISEDVQLDIEEFFEFQSDTSPFQFFTVLWIVNLPQCFVTAHEMESVRDEVRKCLW